MLYIVGSLTLRIRVGNHQPHMKYNSVDLLLNQAGSLLTSVPLLIKYMTLENPV